MNQSPILSCIRKNHPRIRNHHLEKKSHQQKQPLIIKGCMRLRQQKARGDKSPDLTPLPPSKATMKDSLSVTFQRPWDRQTDPKPKEEDVGNWTAERTVPGKQLEKHQREKMQQERAFLHKPKTWNWEFKIHRKRASYQKPVQTFLLLNTLTSMEYLCAHP